MACEQCVIRSLVQSEAVGLCEQSMLAPGRARAIMKQDQHEMLESLRREDPQLPEQLRQRCESMLSDSDAIWAICRHDPDYLSALEQLEPELTVLYGLGERGCIDDLDGRLPGVALVGARRASGYGRDVAYQLGRDLAAAGLSVISGMALGIDGAAHRGALSAGGRTVAVLAGGADVPYPSSHRRLYDEILESGAVVSERPPGSKAQRWGFPLRNRVIAALAKATVLVEGTLKTGANHTVSAAQDLGLDVGAVPGPVTSPLSDAPNKMLSEGAKTVRDARDVLDFVCWPHGSESLPGIDADPTSDLDPTQHDVLAAVAGGAGTPHTIARELQSLSVREIASALGQLELGGLIARELHGGYRPVRDRPEISRKSTR